MTYIETLHYTATVIWLGFMALLLLATVINSATGESEAAENTSVVLLGSIVVSLVVAIIAFLVWISLP
jgi:hypothetical protein